MPLLDIVKTVEKLISHFQPRVVYTHHGGDLNIDHAITFRATLTDCRPVKGCSVRDIYAYEVPSSTEWSFNQFHPDFNPTMFVDITTHMETKLQAIQYYEGEFRPSPHPRSPEGLRAIARRWGTVVESDYVEAFQTIRSLK